MNKDAATLIPFLIDKVDPSLYPLCVYAAACQSLAYEMGGGGIDAYNLGKSLVTISGRIGAERDDRLAAEVITLTECMDLLSHTLSRSAP